MDGVFLHCPGNLHTDGVKMKQFFTLTVIAVMLLSAGQIMQRQMELSEKLIRLHVVANSDSREDQQIKLSVRDAVLAQVEQETAGVYGHFPAGQKAFRAERHSNLPVKGGEVFALGYREVPSTI